MLKIGEDPCELAQSGWGIILPSDPIVRDALSPLLEYRRTQAGARYKHRYREIGGTEGYRSGDSKSSFLARHGAAPGPVDPDRMPYYLLIAGDPSEISFSFQCQLGVRYRVGRVCFDTYEEYESYARSVVEAETKVIRPRTSIFWSVDHPYFPPLVKDLTIPLAQSLALQNQDWTIHSVLAENATKVSLHRVFRGDTPTVLFIAAHGLGFPDHGYEERQAAEEGAVVCNDWPGPHYGFPNSGHIFSAADLPPYADLRGVVVFYCGCHGAGTSKGKSDPKSGTGERSQHSVSLLARRLLGGNGALAFISHVNKAWVHSFKLDGVIQLYTFEAALNEIFAGRPVGLALKHFSDRYAELAAELYMYESEQKREPEWLMLLQAAAADAKEYILIGDPAARPQLEGKP